MIEASIVVIHLILHSKNLLFLECLLCFCLVTLAKPFDEKIVTIHAANIVNYY